MLLKVALVVLVLVVVLLVVIALQPAEFTVTRSATIAAPPEVVFAQVNDFKAWNAWSPWAKRDPNCRYTFGGSPAGRGATYAWEGNGQVGSGMMTITESRPGERVEIDLRFIKPFPGASPTVFTFVPDGAGGTRVTWTMSGRKVFATKAIGLLISMDKMIGRDFEQGLANMKAIAETPGTPPPPDAPTASVR